MSDIDSRFLDTELQSLSRRRIKIDTTRKYGYGLSRYSGQTVHVAPYYRDGQLVAQHLRFPNKDFIWIGSSSGVELFGQHLWGSGGKVLHITEGEIDCLTLAQIRNLRWPVVSIPSGVNSAKKAIQANYDYVSSFEEIIICFDMDEPGRKAAKEVAMMLPPGKAKIASFSRKDVNEVYVQDGPEAVMQAIFQAQVYRPDGIIPGTEMWETIVNTPDVEAIPYPWESLNHKTHGQRRKELVTITAGSGIGKSTICRMLAHHLLKCGETVGYIALEEDTRRSALGFMSIELEKPLHLSTEGVSRESMRQAYDATLGTGRLYLYDHFGSMEIDNLLSRIRYLAVACGCQWIFLDHLSIVISGLEGGDERRMIDQAMTMLRSLVEETGIGLFLVSHLTTPEGRSHEEGGQVSLRQLRGSRAIGQLSDMVIGAERNQQAGASQRDVMTLRILKNRFSGETGEACKLRYDRTTGLLRESHEYFEDYDDADSSENGDNDF